MNIVSHKKCSLSRHCVFLYFWLTIACQIRWWTALRATMVLPVKYFLESMARHFL